MGWKVIGVILWVIALVGITLMCSWNVDEVKTSDLSAIEAKQIVAGYNRITADYEVKSPMAFVGRSYDLVMVGVENDEIGKLTYLGLVDGEYYKARESFSLGAFQKVKEVRIENESLVIVCGKGWYLPIFLSIIGGIIFGVLGAVAFCKD